ncbi:MAG: sensor histidine kinase [Bacteroidetes bacterium]|nr:sensor histidine kinase [Bacteroidota bacterium]
MRRLFLFSTLIFWIGMCISQPTSVVEELNEKARLLSKSDPDSAINLLKKSLEIAFQKNDMAGEAKTYSNLGILYRRTGEMDLAFEAYEKALEISLENEDSVQVAKIHENLGHLYQRQGNFGIAIDHHLKSLKIREDLKDADGRARSLSNLGVICTIRRIHDEALSYFNESLAIRQRMDDQEGIASVSTNLGNLYFEMGAFDSAYHYHHQSLMIASSMEDSMSMANGLNNLGQVMMAQKDLEKAITYHNQALTLRKEIRDLTGQLYSLNNLGACQERLNNYREAIRYFGEALELAKKLQLPDETQEIYYNLFVVHNDLGQFEEALDYHRLYAGLKDSIYDIETQSKLAEAAVKFEQAQTERKLVETQKALAEERAARMVLIGGIVILVLLVCIVSALGYSVFQHQKSEKLQVEHKHKMNQQIIVDLLKDQEMESLDAMVEGQEKERQRIAADLHDSLGGTLAAVKVSLYTLHRRISDQPDTTLQVYDQTNQFLEEACETVRRISHNLSDSTLENVGLVTAITNMYDTLANTNQFEINMETSGFEDERLERTVEINLYRIVQELFQNIVKHADASKVSLYMNRFDDHISVVVEDNGVGFTYFPDRNPKTLGLASISARVKKLNGNLRIDTAPGQGTTTEINVPV